MKSSPYRLFNNAQNFVEFTLCDVLDDLLRSPCYARKDFRLIYITYLQVFQTLTLHIKVTEVTYLEVKIVKPHLTKYSYSDKI